MPWRLKRLVTFLDPWADQQGAGFQVVQSLIAIGSGGLDGLGFAQGKQKMLFLPFAHSDFIFAVIGEELGLVGALAVVAQPVMIADARVDRNAVQQVAIRLVEREEPVIVFVAVIADRQTEETAAGVDVVAGRQDEADVVRARRRVSAPRQSRLAVLSATPTSESPRRNSR